MKITKNVLKQIIKEELSHIEEAIPAGAGPAFGSLDAFLTNIQLSLETILKSLGKPHVVESAAQEALKQVAKAKAYTSTDK